MEAVRISDVDIAQPRAARITRMARLRAYACGLLGFIAGAVVCVVGAELMLRGLPVTSGRAIVVDDQVGGLRRWAPNTSYTHSDGWKLDHPVHGATNNAGFVCPTPFRAGDKPIVFVGDSFIEAEMIPPGHAYPEVACQRLGGVPCYRMGMARSGLAEYVALAEFAAREYQPRGLVVNIVEGDIADSLPIGKRVPGMHYFDPDKGYELVQMPADGANASHLLKRSALLRYVAMNLRIDPSPRALAQRAFGTPAAAGGSADASHSEPVITRFLHLLETRTGLAPQRILIVVDAERSFSHGQPPDMVERAQRSQLISRARERGFTVVDLQGPLEGDWNANKLPQDSFPADRHWNQRTHSVIAAAVAEGLATAGLKD